MTVKEKLKNGKDRVVKFVNDHKVGLAMFGAWAATSTAVLIGARYDVTKAYISGFQRGKSFGCGDGIKRALSCICDHTDLTEDDVNSCMEEHAPDYGLRQKKEEE